MHNRTLGQHGLTTSAIGFGSMGISLAYGPGDHQEGIATIQKAHDLGVTFFDTAEMYGWGENEQIVSRAVKSFRDEDVLATKFGFTAPDYGLDSRPEHIRHAHAVQPVSVLQTEYSLFGREVETLFPVLGEPGIGFVPYSPLGRGFLTGTAKPANEYDETDMRRGDLRWQPGNFEKNVNATRQLTELAESKGATVAQLALAWLLAQGEHIVPIPGTRSPKRVENIRAADLTLSAEDINRIAQILPTGGFGSRYPEGSAPVWN